MRRVGRGGWSGALILALTGLSIGAPTSGQLPTLEDDPVVEIGASAVDERDQLGRVVDLLLLPDGGVAILDELPAALRIYDAEGRFVRDIGGPGEGPGEFVAPVDVAWIAGTLVVLDRDGRTSTFSPDGALLGTDRVSPAGLTSDRYNPNPSRILPDGRVLFEARERMFGRADGEYRQTAQLVTRRSEDQVQTFGTFAADTGRAEGNPVIPRPYIPGDRLLYASSGDRLIVLDGAGRLSIGRSERDAVRSLPEAPSRAVIDSDVEEERAALLGPVTSPNDIRVVGEWLDGMPRAERTPPGRSLLVDDAGRIWIEWWPRADGRARWGLFQPDGTELGETGAPAGLQLRDVRGDRAAGIWKDPFGVERVRIHRIR